MKIEKGKILFAIIIIILLVCYYHFSKHPEKPIPGSLDNKIDSIYIKRDSVYKEIDTVYIKLKNNDKQYEKNFNRIINNDVNEDYLFFINYININKTRLDSISKGL